MGGTSKTCWIVAVLIMLAMGAAAQEAAPLSLPEAVKITLANNRMHRAALADTKASAAGVREARSPAAAKDYLRRELTAGNDPVSSGRSLTVRCGSC